MIYGALILFYETKLQILNKKQKDTIKNKRIQMKNKI